jgi:Serpentine type 7TM GPCR chemoreceptor Srv
MVYQSDSVNAESTLTDAQEKLLVLLPFFPAVVSIAASSTIIYLVCKSGFDTPYKRILFGLSVSDIVISVLIPLQPFLVPIATSQRTWASGNHATCTLLGTIMQLAMSSLLYNGMLSYYYLLTIRFGVKEKTFARRFEPWMHALAIGYPLVTSIIGASINAYHELEVGFGCWISDYPPGCNEEKGECTNVMLGWIFMGAWMVFIVISIVVIYLMIFCHVRHQMARTMRSSLSTEQQTKRTKEVAIQAFLYVSAFIATFVWTLVLKVLETQSYDGSDEGVLFPVMVLNALLLPSAGIFNLCIYLRPRYVKTRSDFPDETALWAVKRALYGESIPPTASSGTSTQDKGSSSTFDAFRDRPSESFALDGTLSESNPDLQVNAPCSAPSEAIEP